MFFSMGQGDASASPSALRLDQTLRNAEVHKIQGLILYRCTKFIAYFCTGGDRGSAEISTREFSAGQGGGSQHGSASPERGPVEPDATGRLCPGDSTSVDMHSPSARCPWHSSAL